jgi:hypothetical protein
MLALLGLVVSLCGNYIQYRNNQDQLAQQARNNEEQLAQERAKWEDERLKTRTEQPIKPGFRTFQISVSK